MIPQVEATATPTEALMGTPMDTPTVQVPGTVLQLTVTAEATDTAVATVAEALEGHLGVIECQISELG